MGETVEKAREVLTSALAALDQEERRLSGALEQLQPGKRRVGSNAGKAPAPRRPAKRAPAGQRQKQLLDAVAKNPGAPVPELAATIGISSTQAYGLVRSAKSKKLIVKDGKGFALAKGSTRGRRSSPSRSAGRSPSSAARGKVAKAR